MAQRVKVLAEKLHHLSMIPVTRMMKDREN